jgi:hypothetical protein
VELIGFFDTPGKAEKVYVLGNYAYVADSNKLRVIDIIDPTKPREISAIDITAWDVYVSGKYAYVVGGLLGGLTVIDVSDPTNLREVSSFYRALPRPFWPKSVYVSGNYAYVTFTWDAPDTRGGLLSVIDISDPTNLKEVNHTILLSNPYRGADYAGDVYVSGNYAYVLGWGWWGDTMEIYRYQ